MMGVWVTVGDGPLGDSWGRSPTVTHLSPLGERLNEPDDI
jgi:hypothetical protein